MGLSEPLQAIPTSSPSLSKGLIRIVSPDGLIQKEKFDKHVAERAQHKPEVLSLASHIKTGWAAAHRAKQDIETELLRCLRQRNGEYDPSDLAKIQRHGGTDVFMMLTSVKCRAAEAKMNEVLMPPGDKPWSLDPTPIPELPEDTEAQLIQQVETEALQVLALQGIPFNQDDLDMRLNELHDQMLAEKVKMAKQAMGRMEHHIQDDLLQGGFYPALSDFIKDISTFPTAFLCGPEIKLKRVLVWKRDGDGHWSPSVEPRYTRTYRRVSPFDCYPAPGAKHIQDGYFIERIRYRRTDLMQMIGVEGYNNDAIRGALDDYGRGGLREWLAIDQERFRLENRGLEEDDPDPPIDALIYWGSVQGTKLLEWGIDKSKIPDPWADYQITGILIGNWVVMARTNGHPLGRRPYYATSFETANDAIWGKSPPMLMRDVQEVCNGTARALVNNLSIASGPQGEIATDRLQPGQDAEDIYPWKLWKVKFDTLTGKPAINWFQPDAFSAELIKVYDYFFQQASEQSGIPAYTYGNEKIGGAGETASGLAMLLNNANSNMRNVITHIDQEVIVEVIKEHWTHIMLFDDNIYKVGDVKVLARASEYLIMAEQLQLRRGEFLQNTNNPTDLAIMGLKGRASLLREQVKTLKMPNDDVVPTKDEMIIMEGQMAGVMGGEGEVPLLPQGGGGNTAQGSPEAPGGGKQGGEQVKPQEPKVTQ